jgi:hypothetical protein
MSLSRTMRCAFTLAFAAWMTLCCCEKRILAQSFSDGDAAASAVPSCCAGCERSEDKGDGPSEDSQGQPGNCADGCCRKWSATLPAWTCDVDTIGVPVAEFLAPPGARDDAAGRVLSHDDRCAGEPPPRLTLVISRRLRI